MKDEGKQRRRKIIRNVLLLTVGFLVYAYAVQATRVNLRVPLEPQRQENLISMLRQLARPEIFAYESETRSVHLTLRTPCPEQPLASQIPSDGRLLLLEPNCATTTQDRITVYGQGFRPHVRGALRWHPPGEDATPRQLTTFRADQNGNFEAQFTLPDVRVSDERQTIEVRELIGQSLLGFSDSSRITGEKIVETIFMALMASTFGTLIAIPISFLAARNLMATTKASLAGIMAAIAVIPIGGWLGLTAANGIMGVSAVVADQTTWGVGALILATALTWPILRLGPPVFADEPQSPGVRTLSVIRILATILLLLFSLIVLAQLGVVFGRWLQPILGPFGFLGNFVFILSDLSRLLFPTALALVGATMAMSLGNRYGEEAMLRLEGVGARLLTAVLSALGTAVFIYGVGAVLNWLYQFENPANWTTTPALVGGILVGFLSLAAPPKHQFPIGLTIYAASRGLLNTLRSIEPIILAVVFVIWVGLGAFAGILALMVHSVADLGKLFSEEVENISQGPIEAITATGASRLQTIFFAVVPQIIPPYISFIFYRWDINVRMSTIIGFVGGGGIGAVLLLSTNLLQYRRASVMIIAIALTVSLLDYISAELRNRLV